MSTRQAKRLSDEARECFNRICADALAKFGEGWGAKAPKHDRLADRAWHRWERRYKGFLRAKWGDQWWFHWKGSPR